MNESEPLMKRRKRRSVVKTQVFALSGDKSDKMPVLQIGRQPALRWHEPKTGFDLKHGNLVGNENRNSTRDRNSRLKVGMFQSGADGFVVARKVL